MLRNDDDFRFSLSRPKGSAFAVCKATVHVLCAHPASEVCIGLKSATAEMGIGGVFCAQSHARAVLAGMLVCDAAPHVHASVLSGTRSAGVPCVPTEATMNAAGNHNFLYGTHRIYTLLHVTYGKGLECDICLSLTSSSRNQVPPEPSQRSTYILGTWFAFNPVVCLVRAPDPPSCP